MNIFALTTPEEDAMSFWEELWEYIYGVYLNVDQNYGNFGLDTGTITSVRVIVLGIFIGVIIACVSMAYNKQVLGALVRRALANDCRSKERAQTLCELGYHKNPLLRSAVQRNVNLRRVLHCVEEEEFYREQNEDREAYEKKREQEPSLPKFRDIEYIVDPSRDHFYIPEEKCDMAELKFDGRGSTWMSTIIWIIVLFIAFFILLLILPNVLTVVDDFIGTFNNNDPTLR